MAQTPTLLDVVNALETLTIEKTKDLAFQLGVDLHQLDDIDTEYSGTNRSRHYIEAWLRTDPEASWAKIVAALKRIRHNVVAASIASQHCSSTAVEYTSSLSSTSRESVNKCQLTPSLDLAELLRLKLPERVGVHYQAFGIFLLDDRNGYKVNNMKMRCHGDPEAIVTDILQTWLGGSHGETPSWKNLVESLRLCELNVLAKEIEEHAAESSFV